MKQRQGHRSGGFLAAVEETAWNTAAGMPPFLGVMEVTA